MADEKISDLVDGGAAQATDELVVARSGTNVSLKGNVFDAAGAAAAAQVASQPLDSDLTAIAALSTTSFGRALLTLADAAAMRTTAGTVIGTNVEAWDADLDDIAALAPTNDDIVQRKAGHWTNRTMAQLIADLAGLGTTFQPLDSDLTSIAALSTTSYGRGLLTLANAAAADWITNALVDAKGDLIVATADNTPSRVAVGADGQMLSALASATPGVAWAYPPGYEINYTQITSTVNIVSTSESSGTSIIAPGAVTFDGAPVLVDFFAAGIIAPNAAAGNLVILSLFEGATQIGRLLELETPVSGSNLRDAAYLSYRFTPSAGSHTYTVTAFASSTTGTPAVLAGAGGTAARVPAYVRFTKV